MLELRAQDIKIDQAASLLQAATKVGWNDPKEGLALLATAAEILVGGKVDQRVTPGLVLHAPGFLETQQREETDRRLGIGDAHHGVEIAHDQATLSWRASITSSAVRVALAGFWPVTRLSSRRAKGAKSGPLSCLPPSSLRRVSSRNGTA